MVSKSSYFIIFFSSWKLIIVNKVSAMHWKEHGQREKFCYMKKRKICQMKRWGWKWWTSVILTSDLWCHLTQSRLLCVLFFNFTMSTGWHSSCLFKLYKKVLVNMVFECLFNERKLFWTCFCSQLFKVCTKVLLNFWILAFTFKYFSRYRFVDSLNLHNFHINLT